MPLFLLIRHAENDYIKKGLLAGRMPEVHLNEKGQAQAQALAEALGRKLAKTPLKVIYSSPMERALETAEPIAKNLGLEVVSREGLLEVDIGEWQGQPLKSLRRLKLWRSVQGVPSLFRFPQGESFADAQNRIRREIEGLSSLHTARDVILAVSHADPIRLAVAYYLGMPLDCFQRLVIAPASVTTLFLSDKGSQLLNMNADLAFAQPKR
jgi:probable phosphoglycerate mutase